MLKARSLERHPLESLLYLILLAFAGAVLFTLLGMFIGALIYGAKLLFNLQEILAGNDEKSLNFLKLIQSFSTVGTFILPAVLFARIESKRPFSYLKLSRISIISALLAIVLIISFLPFLEFTISLNKTLKLPGFLNGMEEWMRVKEREMELLTEKLLQMNNWQQLSINLLMIAVLPAIGEEFFFRGCLQQTLQRWVKNYHAAIWITAIIFSSIHFQFYGFIPRMLLGAILGYLFVWGKSIWLPVIAHFANNGFSVVAAYYYLNKGESTDKMDQAVSGNYALYFLSFSVTLLILWNFYKSAKPQVQLKGINGG